MNILRQDKLQINNGSIPIALSEDNNCYAVSVDGVEWVKTSNMVHAVVMFEMMKDHITEYMHYEAR